MLEGGESWRERVGEIRVPTLVLDVTEIRCFRSATPSRSRARSGSTVVRLERMGDELPRAVWDVVVPAILRHTANG